MPSAYPTILSDQLRATAELLRLPEHAVASALVFMHRFKRDCGDFDMTDDRLIAACLFAAAKVEETPVRTNDLLNALQYILQPCNSRELAQAFPGLLLHQQSAAIDHSASQPDEHGQPAQMHNPKESASQAEGSSGSRLQKGLLAGDDYYAAKEQLITDEQILLRILCFEITVEHPHKFLLNLCSVLQCEKPLIQLALCLVNDSLGETQLCLRFSPLEVAAGCLHLASTILGVAERLPHSKQLGWWGVIGVEQRTIEEVAHCLCDAAEAREQLKGAASTPLT